MQFQQSPPNTVLGHITTDIVSNEMMLIWAELLQKEIDYESVRVDKKLHTTAVDRDHSTQLQLPDTRIHPLGNIQTMDLDTPIQEVWLHTI